MVAEIVSIADFRARDRRAYRRREADVLGLLSNGAENSIGCLVIDVSAGGAKVCAAEHLSAGERLLLSIPGLGFTAEAVVVWASADAAGLAFRDGFTAEPRRAEEPLSRTERVGE
jgi:hypothetical protein